MSEFTHLHVHTQYSILDGQADIKVLIKKVVDYGMKAVAITDHGNMFGVFDFFKTANDYKIKPILGCEMYVAEGNRFEKKGREDRSGFHLILLAKNYEGYKNLSKLSSLSFKKEAFYYTSRIDKEILKQYSRGLIATSACIGGEIPQLILNSDIEKAEQVLLEYKEIFGNDFYLELQNHNLPEQLEVNEVLIQLAKKYDIKLIASNDVHFVNADDAKAHDILVCLNTSKDFDDPTRMRYSGQEYLKSPEEMMKLFVNCPEAITNTQEIVDKIENYDLYHAVIMPSFPIPEGFDGEDSYLTHLTFKGAEKLYPDLTDEIKDRINYELKVISEKGFAGYFLIVSDYINEAKKQNVAVGPGRGSAAGSVVAFCVGITGIDPIKYNLLFERFLNPERPSMPDIDVDFDDDGREKVKNYVIEKYGVERVAQIITFGTMAAKSAIRDVARVLKLPLSESDRLAKLVPLTADMNLKKAFKEVPELNEAKEKGSALVRDTLIYAEKLEGSIRHTGVHACGIIIGRDDLNEHIPLSTAKDADLMVTQYEGNQVESVGMLKMDFLGLKTLSIINDAIENIEHRHHIKINIETIPLDDDATFKLFQNGDTVGTFQFESDGMRNYLKDLKPTSMEDLIAMNALYRPGPMDYIPQFIKRKLGKEKVEYPHPWLEELLKPTYGIMVYQEQIMQTAQIMAGYSLGAADNLRRAMGKKKKEVMEKERAIFVQGAENKGVEKKNAEEVFDVMEKFAQYGFNRSHAAAYSVIAYQTAYLKALYPAEYMAAVLTRNLSDLKKITFFMDECRRMGISVLGPDVNESEFKFVVNAKGQIRFGLGAVKGVGESAVEAITSERKKNGNFSDIFELTKRVNLHACNKRCMEALAMAGAFDSFADSHRAQYLFKENNEESSFIDKIIKHSSLIALKKSQSQHSLFGDDTEVDIANPALPVTSPWSKMEMLAKEKEVTGIYLSGHPLDDYRIEIQNFCNIPLTELSNDLKQFKGRELKFAGILTSASHRYTKTGKPFGSFTLEDYDGNAQFVLFSEDYLKFKHFLEKEALLLYVKATVKERYGNAEQMELKITHIGLLSELLQNMVNELILKIKLSDLSEELINNIFKSIKKKKGNCKIKFYIEDVVNNISVEMPSKKWKINPTDFLKSLAEFPQVKFKINC